MENARDGVTIERTKSKIANERQRLSVRKGEQNEKAVLNGTRNAANVRKFFRFSSKVNQCIYL